MKFRDIVLMLENSSTSQINEGFPNVRGDILPILLKANFEKVRVIGDVHGNMPGLTSAIESSGTKSKTFFLFLGDLVDYHEDGIKVVEIVSELIKSSIAITIRGNHERKIFNWVTQTRGDGFRGKITHGNDHTIDALLSMDPKERIRWEDNFIELVKASPDWIRIGDFLFTHGAAHSDMWDYPDYSHTSKKRAKKIEALALYGETDGTVDEKGYPTRTFNWIEDIPQGKHVMVGHSILSTEDPVRMASSKNPEIPMATFLDTGSSKGGKLSWIDLQITSTGLIQ